MAPGPDGQWRPDSAAFVCKISLGESPEMYAPPAPTRERQRMMLARASKGGKARAVKLTPERRSEIAAGTAAAREVSEEVDRLATSWRSGFFRMRPTRFRMRPTRRQLRDRGSSAATLGHEGEA